MPGRPALLRIFLLFFSPPSSSWTRSYHFSNLSSRNSTLENLVLTLSQAIIHSFNPRKSSFMPTFLFLIALIAIPHCCYGFPRALRAGMKGENGAIIPASEVVKNLKARQILGLNLGDLTNALNLDSIIPTFLELPPVVAAGRKRIPDKYHPFKAPGPTDARGGCPGMNMMANYGYIPRNGIASMTQLIYGMEEMFGFGPDMSLVLVALALKTSVDLTTMKMSIGGTDSRTDGPLSGLFGTAPGVFSNEAHDKLEVDGSLTTLDGYFANGSTVHFSSDRWKKYRQVAIDRFDGLMTVEWAAEVRFMQFTECRDLNPTCHWAAIDQAHFYAVQGLIHTAFVSSGPNGKVFPPKVELIDKALGFSQNPDGSFSRRPNELPPSPDGFWYRRATPLTVVDLATAFSATYLPHPVLFGANNGTAGDYQTDLTDPSIITGTNVACYLLQRTRDTSNSRHSDNSEVLALLETLLDNTLAPIFKKLSC